MGVARLSENVSEKGFFGGNGCEVYFDSTSSQALKTYNNATYVQDNGNTTNNLGSTNVNVRYDLKFRYTVYSADPPHIGYYKNPTN